MLYKLFLSTFQRPIIISKIEKKLFIVIRKALKIQQKSLTLGAHHPLPLLLLAPIKDQSVLCHQKLRNS